MRQLVLSLALCLVPLGATAQSDMSAIEDLADGAMKKLVFHDAPQDVPDITFGDLDGGEHRLADYEGQIVLLNFWATWCAPCRTEMPSLSALQAALGGDAFQVVTLASGANTPAGIRRFMEEEGINNLPLFNDPKQELARNMAVLGLPVSVILDRDGKEIARLRGDAEWDTDSAKAIIRALIAMGS